MSFKMYQIPRVRLDFGTGHDDRFVMLRALTPADCWTLFRQFAPELKKFAATLEGFRVAGEVNLLDLGQVVAQALDKIPGAASHAIALAADEPDQAATAASLPLPVQMDALEKIFGLTFAGEDSIKKALEVAIKMFQGTRGLIDPSPSEPSKSEAITSP